MTRDVTLPGGHIIRAETAVDTRDTMRGLMFRATLAPDHGMLFVHPVSGQYSYWMYQTYIPLDMIWMDENHRIVELVERAAVQNRSQQMRPFRWSRDGSIRPRTERRIDPEVRP